MKLRFRVHGIPQPQGSARAFVRGGRAVVTSDNVKLRPWRDSVTAAAYAAIVAAGWQQAWGAVHVELVFELPRPKGHYRVSGGLRPTAPEWPTTKPDLDKLVRSSLDSLTAAGVWRDDSQVVQVSVVKAYAATATGPGAWIEVAEL